MGNDPIPTLYDKTLKELRFCKGLTILDTEKITVFCGGRWGVTPFHLIVNMFSSVPVYHRY